MQHEYNVYFKYTIQLMLVFTIHKASCESKYGISTSDMTLPQTCELDQFNRNDCKQFEMYHCLLVNATGKTDQFKETCLIPQLIKKGHCPIFSNQSMEIMKCVESSKCPGEEYLSFYGIKHQGCKNLNYLKRPEEEKDDKASAVDRSILVKCECPPPRCDNIVQVWLCNIFVIFGILCTWKYLEVLPYFTILVKKIKSPSKSVADDWGRSDGVDHELIPKQGPSRNPKKENKVLPPRPGVPTIEIEVQD